MPVADIVSATVQMNVDQALAVHVEQEIALAVIDYEIDADVLPELGLARIPEGLRLFEELVLARAHAVPPGREWEKAPKPVPLFSPCGRRCLRSRRMRGARRAASMVAESAVTAARPSSRTGGMRLSPLPLIRPFGPPSPTRGGGRA